MGTIWEPYAVLDRGPSCRTWLCLDWRRDRERKATQRGQYHDKTDMDDPYKEGVYIDAHND